MNREYIDAHNVIERYLLGKLSEPEAIAFEDAFAFNSDLRDEIDIAEQLIVGLRAKHKNQERQKSESDLESSLDKNPDIKKQNLPLNEPGKNENHTKRLLQLSLAANMLLGIGGALWYVQEPNAVNSRFPDSLVNIPSITLEVSRGSQAELASLPYNKNPIMLAISGTNASAAPQDLRIYDSNRKLLLEEQGVELDPLDPWIEWIVDGSRLPPGEYALELSPTTQSKSDEIYTINFAVIN